ncbi:uncharacterized protein MONOS_18055 [Monocercomonoides exilis]|uniref:uncharacterized protein n=1 Tax=Monocercomonoides exilis TaxID=2049356 RepID=UPI0035593A70|nr:hypothetical protein MONOS_18055 [Monocercomonoides exilis]
MSLEGSAELKVSAIQADLQLTSEEISELIPERNDSKFLLKMKQISVRLQRFHSVIEKMIEANKSDQKLSIKLSQMLFSLENAESAFKRKIKAYEKISYSSSFDEKIDSDKGIISEETGANQQLLLKEKANATRSILEYRETEFRRIHKEIVAVREASEDLKHILEEQTDQLETVDDQIYISKRETEKASDELLKAKKHFGGCTIT